MFYNIETRSAFILTQKVLPYLILSKGSIVNVSSVTGKSKDKLSLKLIRQIASLGLVLTKQLVNILHLILV
jgi:hypothetical protein